MENYIHDILKPDLLDQLPIPIAFHSLNFTIPWANKAYQKAIHLTNHKIKGQKCYMTWGQKKPCSLCPVKTSIEVGEPTGMELTSSGDNHWHGSRLFWMTKCLPVRDKTGNILGVFEISFEAANKNNTEMALRKSETILKEAQYLAKIGSWDLDLKTNCLTWSDEIFRIFEVDPAGFGASYEAFIDMVHPDDKTSVDVAYKASIKTRIPYSLCHRLLLRNGRIKYVHNRCKTYYAANGEPVRSIGTVQDITRRKQAELEYKNLQEQYMQAQKMESIARLASGVAHDFNNMLFVILGNMDMILDHMEISHPLHDALKDVKTAALRSAELVRHLLAFARRQTIIPQTLNLNDVIGNMIKMMKRLIGENIDLVWIPGAELGRIKMDPSQVDQVLANLCVNARDAISDIGKITIETHNATFTEAYCAEHLDFYPGSYVMLAVSDDGCGMNQETSTRIFEPFFTTKEEEKGTGLGLATVYGIVKQNGGFINVYTEPDNGTTFKLYFSVHESETKSNRIEPELHPPRGNGEKILLVEDETAFLKTGRKMLEAIGYQVLTVNSPMDALKLANNYSGSIDLLITDIVMPEMKGQDLAATLKTIWPGLKTLFISGYTADVILHHGGLDKGVAFLQKPFSKTELALKINNII
ncbi:hybrid sensor histidine kinase/response regulator [Desulfobacula toluolica]|uniref:histidine kinase n=1 Tax=Desulfobacula toluolica (strain DSM 7467 / Tol2) TaxID=651182 RepID=K0NCC4_DESTT|nr:hybrid sensor histidine kinase/response regulator [Desulfobacula toluolica]CCK82094.1 two component system sensor histidine kinase, hybrid [Desulfobacula toluolica Tol2]